MTGTMPDPTLSIVVPCFNEAEVVHELHRRVSAVCAAAALPYEILLVNDGSSDATWPAMVELCQADSHLRAVNLSRNFGHQLALSAGLSVARGQRILVLDADLQDPPELLPQMLKRMDEGADVVYGQRTRRDGETLLKRMTAKIFYRLLNSLSDLDIPADTGDFRLMNRRVLDAFNRMPERHRYVRGMIAWVGFKQVPIHYDRRERFAGKTKYPFRKMLRFAFDALTSFSVTPLKLSIWVGLLTAVIAVLLLVWTIVAWLLNHASVMGWTSLLSAISFFSAVQLFVLGIMGEYLARVVEQTRGRPLYLIGEIVGGEASS
ncbi:MAG TPA: glycosyltransferase family 2 protein [Tepidisphaeraceae bacterium]|jgi:dolichol-phosphate mannosyltransferase